MENIHVIPTDNTSRLFLNKNNNQLFLNEQFDDSSPKIIAHNICITSDEVIKENTWVINIVDGSIYKTYKGIDFYDVNDTENEKWRKIILTTDQDLIKDGVQAIDDKFLEWFVKNPSCEEVKIETTFGVGVDRSITFYKIIIPSEEPKQLFTDYPITELGDEEFKEAPIRQCELLSYDNNKYCYVKVEGIEKEIKRCYIYPQKGRCGKVDCISNDEIKELLKEEPKQETLEETAEIFVDNRFTKQICGDEFYPDIYASKSSIVESHILFAKYQQERSYSEEDLISFYNFLENHRLRKYGDVWKRVTNDPKDKPLNFESVDDIYIIDWFEQFKKK